MTDDPKVYPLGVGVYGVYDADNIVFVDPGEILRAKQLPDTSELRAAVYAAAQQNYAGIGKETILIATEGVISTAEFVAMEMQNRNAEASQPGEDESNTEDTANTEETDNGNE